MSLRTIWRAIGAVKDKGGCNISPELEVAVVKATSNYENPPSENQIREVLNLTLNSRDYVHSFVAAVSKRIEKTRDWIVALKALILIHRLLNEGDPLFREEIILYASTRKGTPRLLDLSNFRDEVHSSSLDHSDFLRSFAMYLEERLHSQLFDRKLRGSSSSGVASGGGNTMPWRTTTIDAIERDDGQYLEEGSREIKLERMYGELTHLQRLLDRLLSAKPTGLAKQNRLILRAIYPLVDEGLKLNVHMHKLLKSIHSLCIEGGQYRNCSKLYDAYRSLAEQFNKLLMFYKWCESIGVARSSEIPLLHLISPNLLKHIKERTMKSEKEEAAVPVMYEIIKPLPPPPENYTPPPPLVAAEPKPPQPQVTNDSVNLMDVAVYDQTNRFSLGLFAGLPSNNGNDGSWVAFSGDGEVPSAWHNTAAEPNQAGWELELVEYARNCTPPPQQPQVTNDFLNLMDAAVSSDDQANRCSLGLFTGLPSNNRNGSMGGIFGEVTSAW